jgi:type I restriction enzyme S subunit
MTEIGPLPEEWEAAPLDDLATVVRGISWRKSEESVSGIPVITIPNISHDGRVHLAIRYRLQKKVSPAKSLGQGDILLVGSSGSVHNVGRAALVPSHPYPVLAFASFLAKAKPRAETCDRSFLFHLLQSRLVDFAACSKRAADGKFNLQVRQLKRLIVPKPPLPEQRKIAAVLNIIRRAIEATDKVIAATKELKKSLMRHLFTYGPVRYDQADQVPLKETEIGPMPEEWDVATLGQAALLVRDKLQPQVAAALPYVGLEHLDTGDSVIRRCGHPTEVRSTKGRFRPGDILYGKLRPYLDKAALAVREGICSTDILILRARGEASASAFLVHLLHTKQFLAFAIGATSGTNHPRTSWAAISGYRLALPPLPEQREIAETLRATDESIGAEENRKSALESLFKTMLHLLMTGRVRVKDWDIADATEGGA